MSGVVALPVKYIFTMICRKPGTVRGLGGTELHGMFFNLLKDADPGAATFMHGLVDKPFSLGCPQGAWEKEREICRSLGGEKYTFAVAALDEQMERALCLVAGAWPGRLVRMGSGIFECEGAERHSSLSYWDILTQPPLTGEIALEFMTPTSFRQRGTQMIFPIPERVFGSLLYRWNCFSHLKLKEDVDFSYIRAKKYRLQTEMVHFEKYMVAGFLGRCTYSLPASCQQHEAQLARTLASFAPFSGVGYKSTMGMGSVELILS